MKKIIDKKTILTIIISGLFFSCVSGYAATIVLSKDVVYDNKTSEAEAVNVQDAVDELYEIAKLGKCPVCEFNVGKTWTFDYTGGEQEFNVPCNGTYKLETWGAQGGQATDEYIGGYGGYSVGDITLSKSNLLYVQIGGSGKSNGYQNNLSGGYNGGGSVTGTTAVNHQYGSGGGATHIALESGLLDTFENKKDKIIIVSGGGGGGRYQANYDASRGKGGNGGGYIGNTGEQLGSNKTMAYGGTQTAGGKYEYFGGTTIQAATSTWSLYPVEGSFGKANTIFADAPGGGGYYGGAGAYSAGGGGSGYIGNTKLTDKSMYCYDCQTSNDVNTKTISNTCVNATPTEKCSKTGNGYAKITLVSLK